MSQFQHSSPTSVETHPYSIYNPLTNCGLKVVTPGSKTAWVVESPSVVTGGGVIKD